jgi:hypothetical protein
MVGTPALNVHGKSSRLKGTWIGVGESSKLSYITISGIRLRLGGQEYRHRRERHSSRGRRRRDVAAGRLLSNCLPSNSAISKQTVNCSFIESLKQCVNNYSVA